MCVKLINIIIIIIINTTTNNNNFKKTCKVIVHSSEPYSQCRLHNLLGLRACTANKTNIHNFARFSRLD